MDLHDINKDTHNIFWGTSTDAGLFPKTLTFLDGYSVVKWEGDTLVVETIGLNDRGWLDGFGHSPSKQMHMNERYHRRDFGHTFDDPKYYTRKFELKASLRLIPDSDLIEYVCTENEKDRTHLK